MEKGYTIPFGAEAWYFVDEPNAGVLASCESAVEVVNGETNMVDARSAFGDELADWTIGGFRFEEFDERVTGVDGRNARPVSIVERHFGHAEQVAVEGKDVVERSHGDADVGNSGRASVRVGHDVVRW